MKLCAIEALGDLGAVGLHVAHTATSLAHDWMVLFIVREVDGDLSAVEEEEALVGQCAV